MAVPVRGGGATTVRTQMFAHLGPTPPAQGADLIARAMGGWVLATLGGHGAGPGGTSCRRRQATNRQRSAQQQREDSRDDRRTPGSTADAASRGGEPRAAAPGGRGARAYQAAGYAAAATCSPHRPRR